MISILDGQKEGNATNTGARQGFVGFWPKEGKAQVTTR